MPEIQASSVSGSQVTPGSRPTIDAEDFTLRIFLDTNVLVDYLEGDNEKQVVDFIDFFKTATPSTVNIDIMTSDYVSWELCGYFKEDIYIKKMMTERGWGFKRAKNKAKNFESIEKEEIDQIGNELNTRIKPLWGFIELVQIMGKEAEGFVAVVDLLSKFSRLQYQDAMVITSAIHQNTRAHILVTEDSPFRNESKRIAMLIDVMKNIPTVFRRNIESFGIKEPKDFSSKDAINDTYNEWFERRYQQRAIGKVIRQWDRDGIVVGIQCASNGCLKAKDYIYLVKPGVSCDAFNAPTAFQISETDFRDYDTEEPVAQGMKVTIRLPDQFVVLGTNLDGALVFLAEKG